MTAIAPVINAMTVDVEDYFHVSAFDGILPRHRWSDLESRVCANTERLVDLFAETGVSATFFVLGWVGARFPRLVQRIAAMGHEIASHGFEHRLVYDMTPQAFREDLRRARGVLESAAGAGVYGYRAPSYSITPRSLWALDILIEEGYRYDASIFPIHHDRYGIPLSPRHPYILERNGGSLVEAPASTLRFARLNLPFAGGGYFRIFPYRWTRWAIARLNAVERTPIMFYLHPWEIDPAQPRLGASLLSRFRHYRNLAETESRLRRLLADFRFAPMEGIVQGVARRRLASAATGGLPYVW